MDHQSSVKEVVKPLYSDSDSDSPIKKRGRPPMKNLTKKLKKAKKEQPSRYFKGLIQALRAKKNLTDAEKFLLVNYDKLVESGRMEPIKELESSEKRSTKEELSAADESEESIHERLEFSKKATRLLQDRSLALAVQNNSSIYNGDGSSVTVNGRKYKMLTFSLDLMHFDSVSMEEFKNFVCRGLEHFVRLNQKI